MSFLFARYGFTTAVEELAVLLEQEEVQLVATRTSSTASASPRPSASARSGRTRTRPASGRSTASRRARTPSRGCRTASNRLRGDVVEREHLARRRAIAHLLLLREVLRRVEALRQPQVGELRRLLRQADASSRVVDSGSTATTCSIACGPSPFTRHADRRRPRPASRFTADRRGVRTGSRGPRSRPTPCRRSPDCRRRVGEGSSAFGGIAPPTPPKCVAALRRVARRSRSSGSPTGSAAAAAGRACCRGTSSAFLRSST